MKENEGDGWLIAFCVALMLFTAVVLEFKIGGIAPMLVLGLAGGLFWRIAWSWRE